METPQQGPPRPRTPLRRILRVALRVFQALLLLLGLYLLVALVGLVPVNNDFRPTPGGVEIIITSNEVHADIVVPTVTEVVDWRACFPAECFSPAARQATHVAFGWGNREFYINTPTWADVKVATVARALFWPSETCMHVDMVGGGDVLPSGRAVRISAEQYRLLVEYIQGSFRKGEDGRSLLITEADHGGYHAFFEAHGRYHCLNTCNCWVSRGMRAAGLRAGWFTPLPRTPYLYLPR